MTPYHPINRNKETDKPTAMADMNDGQSGEPYHKAA